MLPNVIYAGMGKAGSTLLHKLFLKHPDIYVSAQNKEINFFSNDLNWSKGVGWYEDVFSGYTGEQWVVDISPGYHNVIESISRMREVLGEDLKFIFTFRRFTDFAYSRYLHRIRGKMMRGSFLDLLEHKSMFYKPLDVLVGNYVKAFGRDNVLFMHYENDFDRDSPDFERQIYEFLGLPLTKTYYEANVDGGVNSGFCPRFVYAEDSPYEEIRDGVEYRVPKGTLVYCSGRTYKNVHWIKRSHEKALEAFKIQCSWTRTLDEDTYLYVQKKYTEPLAKRLEDTLDISFQHWYVDRPKSLAYQQAPLPDVYIIDPELRRKKQDLNKARKPWM